MARRRGRRPGQYARSQARRHYLVDIRANAWRYAVVFAAVYAATFVVHRVWPREFNSVFVGAMLVVPFWIVSLLLVGRPSAAAWARGADAEAWTSTSLRHALGRDYVVINDTQLHSMNIDHVAIGPAGVFVIETKWSSEPWASPTGTAKIVVARTGKRCRAPGAARSGNCRGSRFAVTGGCSLGRANV